MLIRLGYDIIFNVAAPTTMTLLLSTHPSRASSLRERDQIRADPAVRIEEFIDCFGNRCSRLLAPAGTLRLWNNTLVEDSGEPDPVAPGAVQQTLDSLPHDVLPFLLGSRYCEVDRLSDIAWNLFGQTPLGWARVQAVCNWVHNNVQFGYQYARETRTAFDTFNERLGVCRDFNHLALTFCRCLNIPARYATGYLGDIGVPVSPSPMDFSAWFEVFLGGRWYTFDARHNTPRIGRVLMARGRDATDAAITTSFGPTSLRQFKIWTDEVTSSRVSIPSETGYQYAPV
jgi:transglutaminase-like putative cysteine protease